jgi:hypothetical protein
MNRRSWLKLLPFAVAGGAGGVVAAADARRPIVLYCDLAVDGAREHEMLDAFHRHFKPVAQRHPGYIDLKMLKLRQVVQGGPPPPGNFNYRFQLTYESEELRQRWIASADHRRVWPLIENTVTDKSYLVLLTDSV